MGQSTGAHGTPDSVRCPEVGLAQGNRLHALLVGEGSGVLNRVAKFERLNFRVGMGTDFPGDPKIDSRNLRFDFFDE